MNQIDKNRLTKIAKQIESIINEIEVVQNGEASKYNGLSIDKKQSIAWHTLENNCWLLQPLHDKLEQALSKYNAIKDLIDPSEENYEIANMMANDYKRICEKK